VEAGERIEVYRRNRTRLILQNRKLLAEVFKLETTISSVIEKTAAGEFEQIEQS
jgi:hypothetical protein